MQSVLHALKIVLVAWALTALITQSLAAEPRPWSGKSKPVEKIVEKIVEKRVEVPVPSEPERVTDFVEIQRVLPLLKVDEDAMAMALQAIDDHEPVIVLQGYTIPGCLHCEPAKQRLGYFDGETQIGGDEEVRIEWHLQEAPFKAPIGNVLLYPMLHDPITGWYVTGDRLKDLVQLKKTFKVRSAMKAAPLLQIATLPAVYFDPFRRYVRRQGNFQFGNDELEEEQNGLRLLTPRAVGGQWSSDQNGATSLAFTQAPKVKFSLRHQPVSGLLVTDNQITLQLPWAPDLTIGRDE